MKERYEQLLYMFMQFWLKKKLYSKWKKKLLPYLFEQAFNYKYPLLYFKMFNLFKRELLSKNWYVYNSFWWIAFCNFFFNYDRDRDTKRHCSGGPDLCEERP